MDRTPPRAPTREPLPDFCPCIGAASLDRLHAWRVEADPPWWVLDAVLDRIDDLCLAAELGLLPAVGVAWVPDVPWTTIDYIAVGGRFEVVAVSSLPY